MEGLALLCCPRIFKTMLISHPVEAFMPFYHICFNFKGKMSDLPPSPTSLSHTRAHTRIFHSWGCLFIVVLFCRNNGETEQQTDPRGDGGPGEEHRVQWAWTQAVVQGLLEGLPQWPAEPGRISAAVCQGECLLHDLTRGQLPKHLPFTNATCRSKHLTKYSRGTVVLFFFPFSRLTDWR